MKANLLNRFSLAFSSAGVAIAAALTVAHLSKTPLPCGGSHGCDQVASDPSSQFLGVPISLFGLLAYMLMAGLALLRICGMPYNRQNILTSLVVSGLGAAGSIGLTWYSVTHIHATCAWCLASLSMMVLLTITHSVLAIGKNLEETGHPLTSLPWTFVPAGIVCFIAVFGEASKSKEPDLSSVKLGLASLSELTQIGHVLGSIKSPIVIAEFGDLMCPACRAMHQKVLSFQSKHLDKVSLVFSHFPLPKEQGHELSIPAAEMSEQLSPTAFWKFIEKVYASEKKPDKNQLNSIFQTFKSDSIKDAKSAKTALKSERDLGTRYGIEQTPTYILFVNGKPDAVATSTNLAKVISKPEFAAIMQSKQPNPNR